MAKEQKESNESNGRQKARKDKFNIPQQEAGTKPGMERHFMN
jgi:hypothetical protein